MTERLLDTKARYLQIAFNYDRGMVRRILPTIAYNPRPSSSTRAWPASARCAACGRAR